MCDGIALLGRYIAGLNQLCWGVNSLAHWVTVLTITEVTGFDSKWWLWQFCDDNITNVTNVISIIGPQGHNRFCPQRHSVHCHHQIYLLAFHICP